MTQRPMQYRHWQPSICTVKQQPRPEPGDLIGLPYNRLAYVVVGIGEIPSSDWNAQEERVYEQSPFWSHHPDKDQWSKRPFSLIARRHKPCGPQDQQTVSFRVSPSTGNAEWYVLPDHYAVCAACAELTPCGHYLAEQEAARQGEILERKLSTLPGCCWSCREPVTARQKSIVFDGDNLEVPGGPQVAFHLRSSCFYAACGYEEKWLKADETRRPRITCAGVIVFHHDGAECSRGECPGHEARHPATADHRTYYGEYMLGRLMKEGGFPAVDERFGPLSVSPKDIEEGLANNMHLSLMNESYMGWRCQRCRDSYQRGEEMFGSRRRKGR